MKLAESILFLCEDVQAHIKKVKAEIAELEKELPKAKEYLHMVQHELKIPEKIKHAKRSVELRQNKIRNYKALLSKLSKQHPTVAA